MFYVIGNKRYNQTEFAKYIENKRIKQFNYLEQAIYSNKYNDVTDFLEITEKKFFEDIKNANDIIDLTEIIDCNSKYYNNFVKRQAIVCNNYTSSNPMSESYYSEVIFKYKSRYYKIKIESSN